MATYTTNYNLEKPEASDPFGDFRESYNDNLDIIDANLGGGGGSGNVDDVEVNGVSVLNPQTHVAEITSYKEVTQAQYDALPASKLADGIAYFIKDGGGGSGSGGSFLLVITADTGETVTATKDGTTLTATEVSTGVYEVEVTSAGTWTLSDGTNTATVDVGIYTATLSSVPEGSTVLPTDDVSIWLACGERTEGYTTLSQVLGDSVCLSALLNNNNANDYLVRSTTWASTITADSSAMSYIGLNNYCSNTLLSDTTWKTAICYSTYFESVLNVKAPVMTSNTTPSGYVASARTEETSSRAAYKAFNNNMSDYYCSAYGNRTQEEYLDFEFPEEVTICHVVGYVLSAATNVSITTRFEYYSDGSWVVIDGTEKSVGGTLEKTYDFTTNAKTNKMRVRCLGATADNKRLQVQEIQYYGRKDI